MDINGADGHDFLPVAWCELANQHGNKGFQLSNLGFVELLQRITITFLDTGKSMSDASRPPNLTAGQRHLRT